jgi:lysophospholipase L1-like esterase
MSRFFAPLVLLAAVVGGGILVADFITRPQDEPVAAVGDSITAIGQQQLKISAGTAFDIEVRAEFGKTAADQLPAATALAAQHPEQVIINLGTNDALQHLPTSQTMAALRQMVGLFPHARCIHFVTVSTDLDLNGNTPKAEAAAINRGILALADELDRGDVIRWDEMVRDSIGRDRPQGVTTDGVHPSPEGQRLLADAEVRALVRCGRPWHYW